MKKKENTCYSKEKKRATLPYRLGWREAVSLLPWPTPARGRDGNNIVFCDLSVAGGVIPSTLRRAYSHTDTNIIISVYRLPSSLRVGWLPSPDPRRKGRGAVLS